MATKRTVWVADGTPCREDGTPAKEFETEAEAIYAERVVNVANAITDMCDECTYVEDCANDLADWILKHFVPKSSNGPQAAYPPKVHGPGAPQPYVIGGSGYEWTKGNYPHVPSAVPPAPIVPDGERVYIEDQVDRLTAALVKAADTTGLRAIRSFRQVAGELYECGVRIEPSLPKGE